MNLTIVSRSIRHTSSRFSALIFGLILLSISGSVFAVAPIPSAPKIAANAYLLQDFHSGRILTEHKANEHIEPASLTKLMTAYIVFNELRSETIKLDDPVLISEKAWRAEGSRMFVEVNKRVSVEKLLKGMIIQSGNDASIALAEYVAGSEDAFAALMNHYAQKLGMNDTHFTNSTGMPDTEHYTTAKDLAILAQALISEFPQYYAWYSEKEYTFNGIKQYNRNRMLWRDKTVDGVKTGHTESAGFCLISSALRDDMRLISVVLGTKTDEARAQESQKLLNYGFRFFETHRLYAGNSELAKEHIWKGEVEELPVGITEDLYITIPRGRFKDLDAAMNIMQKIIAPVQKGQELGTVDISLEGEHILERPLVALKDIKEGGFLDRLVDEVKLFFE